MGGGEKGNGEIVKVSSRVKIIFFPGSQSKIGVWPVMSHIHMPTYLISFLPKVISVLRICPLSMLGVSVTPKLVLSYSHQPTQTWYIRS